MYLGERPRLGGWLPGTHEPIVSEEDWQAANKAGQRGRNVSADPLSGHVVCGICSKRMAIAQNGKGQRAYKCRTRGKGCVLPARSNLGLARAAVLGLRLLARDEGLQEAIRRRLAADARADAGRPLGRRRRSSAKALEDLSRKRRRLLDLYYDDKISSDGFQEEEAHLASLIEAAAAQAHEEDRQRESARARLEEFESWLAAISDVDFAEAWEVASEKERRVLVDELVESVTVHPDRLEVKVANAPSITVLFGEVGLKDSESVRVGGPTRSVCYQPLETGGLGPPAGVRPHPGGQGRWT